jgi:D-psicose/D-tagatose/L-ribulose 3-epimerase
MRFGVCGYLRGKNNDGGEFDLPLAARQAGFDYIELPLSTLAGLSEESFVAAERVLERAGMACEACNLFFPAHLRLTGVESNPEQIRAYIELALGRAARIGAKVVVFGSGGARAVPQGFPMEQAWVQLVEMLRTAGAVAARYNLSIAIEPLNRDECNVINSGAEGFALARLVDHPNVGLLLDLYHLYKEQEDFGIAVTAGRLLAHAHFAEPRARAFPAAVDDPGRAFMIALKQSRYDGRVSLEAGYGNFQVEAPRALDVLRELAG